jgi:hypothetical protein
MGQNTKFTYDSALALKAAGLVAASAAGSTILDIGSGFVCANLVLDVTALEVATGDEIYNVCLEGSNVAAMTSGSVCLARIQLGNAGAPADANTATGRFVVPFTNEQNDTLYRYVRVYTEVSGTIATGINYSAFIGMDC